MHAMHSSTQLPIIEDSLLSQPAKRLKEKLSYERKRNSILSCKYHTAQIIGYTGFMLTTIAALNCEGESKSTINAHTNGTVIHAAAPISNTHQSYSMGNPNQFFIGLIGASTLLIADLIGIVRSYCANRHSNRNNS
jgi:hypothetical protein